MSTANRVIKNTMYLYLRMAVSIVFSFFTTRILLQSLGASDYGLYNVVAGALSMLGFLSSSMSSATQRFISYAEGEGNLDKIKTIFNCALYLHRAIAAIACLFFIVAGFFFFNGILNIPEGRMSVAVTVYGCMIFSTVFSITIVPYDAVLNAHENMKYYSLLGIADVLLKFTIALLVMFCDNIDQLLFYGILMAIESWSFMSITRLYCRRQYSEVKTTNKSLVNRTTVKEMATFAGWNMLNISTSMISLYGMNVVINHFFGTVLNAAMGVATQLSGVMMGVSSNMAKAMTPVLVKNEGSHNREQMIRISLVGCKFSYLLFSFFCIPVIFCLRPFLSLWLKNVPEWTETFCLLMFVSTLIDQLFVFLYQSINAEGNVKNYNLVRSVINIVPIFLMCIEFMHGLPPWHALLDWIIFYAFWGGLANLYFSHQNFGLKYKAFLGTVIVPCLFTSVVSAAICCALRLPETASFIELVARLIFMAVANLPFYYCLGLNTGERKVVKEIVNHRIFKR